VVSSNCFSSIISERFSGSTLKSTDGSRSEEGSGFGIYVPGQQGFGYHLQEPSGVFTALLTALRFMESGQPGEFLILTDSLSSIEALRSRKISPRTHSVVYECKEALWRLRADQFVVRLMWVPAHVGIDGNKMVDRIAKESAASENLYRGGALECDLCLQMKSCLLMDWQSKWDGGDMGRYAFSVFPRVWLSPWFLDLVADRPVIKVISRLISNHNRVKTHLSRINIVAAALCGGGCNYETVDHILWSCPLYRHERIQLWSQLSTSNRPICVRDMLALRQWCDIRVCLR
jgi:hypothetical protein